MKLLKTSIIYKTFSVVRWFIASWLLVRLRANGIGIVGRNCRISTPGKTGHLELSRNVILGDETELQAKGILTIGAYTTINRYSRIISFERIEIGNHVTMAQFVTILDHDHAYQKNENDDLILDGYTTSPIKIGNHVWIGDKVTIVKGVTVGDNVIIAAHALVNSDVPSNCIVGGIPAKVIKRL